jgi:hypothetical protein
MTLSQQLRLQKADHPQEIEKTEEEGRKVACGFGEIGENCDFTSPRKNARGREWRTRRAPAFWICFPN